MYTQIFFIIVIFIILTFAISAYAARICRESNSMDDHILVKNKIHSKYLIISLAIILFGGIVFVVFLNRANPDSQYSVIKSSVVETKTSNPQLEHNSIPSQNIPTKSKPETSESSPQDNFEQNLDIPTESLIIVDSKHLLTEEFIKNVIEPKLIVIIEHYPKIPVINEKTQIHSICGESLNNLFEAAKSLDIAMTIRSAFRSYYEQQVAYDQATDKTSVTLPGASQHHTGLAIDFTSPEVGNIVGIYSGFGQSQAGNWLNSNAYQFGFVLSYTNNHDGIRNEDWHYFYVGRDLARIWYVRRAAGENIDVFMLQEQYKVYSRS